MAFAASSAIANEKGVVQDSAKVSQVMLARQVEKEIISEMEEGPRGEAPGLSLEEARDYHLLMGDEFYEKGRYARANEEYRKAMIIEKGAEIAEQKETESALVDMGGEVTAERKGEIIDEILKRGDFFLEAGKYDLAVEQYEQVFLVEPLNKDASERIDTARDRFIEEKKAEIEAEYRMVEKKEEAEVNAYLDRVRTLIKEGRNAEALILVKKVLVIQPKNKEAKKYLEEVQKRRLNA